MKPKPTPPRTRLSDNLPRVHPSKPMIGKLTPSSLDEDDLSFAQQLDAIEEEIENTTGPVVIEPFTEHEINALRDLEDAADAQDRADHTPTDG